MKNPVHNDFWLPAEWPAPLHIHAGTTTRLAGCSRPPFDGFNLAEHVGDENESVKKNRHQLYRLLRLPAEPYWLNQSHSNHVIKIHEPSSRRDADAAYCSRPGTICTVLTADCVPILICNKEGTEIAAIHAGWRGLCTNIIDKTLACFDSGSDKLIAWIGPHISSGYYEVREDVRSACIDSLSETVAVAFNKTGALSWHADLGLMSRLTLTNAGVSEIHASKFCTYRDKEFFYSYRRQNATGRMASLIWIDPHQIG